MAVRSDNIESKIDGMQKDVTEGLQRFAEKMCEEFRQQQKQSQNHVADWAGNFQRALQHDIKTYLVTHIDILKIRSEMRW